MAAPPTAAPSFYADFQSLGKLHAQAAQQDPAALREAAKQFEGLFTAMMLKSMREASLGSGLGDSQETQTYQDMYDQQLALNIAHGKGLGLADMLVQQLTRSNAARAAAAGSSSTGGTNAGSTGTSSATQSVPLSGASAAPSNTISSAQQREFVRKIQPLAEDAGKRLGVDPDTLIAQAALETRWGHSMPSNLDGSSSNNLFGIKASGGWSGVAVTAPTIEYQGGASQSTTASFRHYGNAADSMNDYVSLLSSSSRYSAALGAGSDVHAFGTALQRGGYATDPDYANKLVATAATLRQLRTSEFKS